MRHGSEIILLSNLRSMFEISLKMSNLSQKLIGLFDSDKYLLVAEACP